MEHSFSLHFFRECKSNFLLTIITDDTILTFLSTILTVDVEGISTRLPAVKIIQTMKLFR